MKLLEEINKKFGAGSIFELGSSDKLNVDVISTGIIGLDLALGVGGIPRGRITEIYGQNGCSKTGLTLQTAANAQRLGLKVAFIDMEHALDVELAKLLGVDIDTLMVSQPDSGNMALEITEALVKSGEIDLVIIDSVGALIPMEEVNSDYGDSIVGRMAKLLNQACRRLTPLISNNNVAVIFINQLRDNIGAIGNQSTSITTGGKALPFFATVRLELKRIQQIKTGEDITGHKLSGKVVKNKVAAPFKTWEYEITYGSNDIKLNELIEYGTEFKLIVKGGAWFTFMEQKFQGRDNLKEFLRSNPEKAAQLESEIRTKLGLTS